MKNILHDLVAFATIANKFTQRDYFHSLHRENTLRTNIGYFRELKEESVDTQKKFGKAKLAKK